VAETIYIIDGHSQIYRAYFAPFRDLTSPDGEPTRATYVFCTMLLKLIEEGCPDYLAMAVDGPVEKLDRRKVYAEYKANRPPMPDDLLPQVNRIYEIVEAMHIPILRTEGYEADDVMATAAERLVTKDHSLVLVSRDKDLDQLVGERVVLYDPMKDETFDADAIRKQKGYPPGKAVEVQTLMGDSTDNIPGVPGVGPKTAARLIGKYGSVDEVLAHADELTPKLRENVLASREAIKTSRKLVTLNRDVPVEFDLEAMRFGGVRAEALRPIFEKLGFNRLLERLDLLPKAEENSNPSGNSPAPPPKRNRRPDGPTTVADIEWRCVDTPEALAALAKELRGVKRLAVDTETTATRPMWAELVGVSLAWEPFRAVYVPARGPLGAQTLDMDAVRDALGPVLADPNVEKVGQNLKYDLIVLANAGITLAGPMFDTMIAAHVLDSSRPSYALGALTAEFIRHTCVPIEEVIGRGRKQITMDAAPVETVAPYAAEDAEVTLRLADTLAEKLTAEGLTDLFADLEMPLLPVLARMEQAGVLVDPKALKRQETELSKQADALRERIVAAAGHDFNPDSPKQLGEVLFSEMKMPVLKKTKTGASTDQSVLEQLAVDHELPGLVLDYRRLMKLIGTYLKALAACIHPRTGRVHTVFHQAGTSTGRLSSSDPNLQNIPVRSEQGRQVRSAFVAPKGCMLLSADYSQVELRVLAHLCEDPTLLAAFEADQDIHRIVAAEVFDVKSEDVTPDMRARAKTVNFGIIYGQTAFGLSVTLRIPRGEAAEFIRLYKQRFPRIEEFLAACVAEAKANGHVQTILGRRRAIPEIDARNPQRRALAERLAINSVVQGSAADLIKQAMINIDSRIRHEARPAKMILQIHDELVFEVPEPAVKAEREMIVKEMSGAVKLRVPLKVDVGVGRSWLDAK